jgi:hypothetical protein
MVSPNCLPSAAPAGRLIRFWWHSHLVIQRAQGLRSHGREE